MAQKSVHYDKLNLREFQLLVSQLEGASDFSKEVKNELGPVVANIDNVQKGNTLMPPRLEAMVALLNKMGQLRKVLKNADEKIEKAIASIQAATH